MKNLSIFLCLLFAPLFSYANEFTLVYTGNSYATLYPCGSCPASIGGGITRRAAKIKSLKIKTKNILLIDGGNFTAGGVLDRASINPQMDEKRSTFYYSAMDKIGYDAVVLGEAEFNFGSDFIKSNIKTHKFKFISANADIEGALPYLIKGFPGFKVAVIGLSPESIHKKTGLKIEDYENALKGALGKIKNKANLVILASALGDRANLAIAEKFKELKVIISCGPNTGSAPYEKVQDTIILRPAYRAQDLRMVNFDVKGNKIIKWDFKREPLALNMPEDAAAKEVVPACFTDNDCPAKPGLISRCQNPGELKAACAYYEPKRFEALLITDEKCPFCTTEVSKTFLKGIFAGIDFKVIDYHSKEALNLIKKYSVTTLPCFILPKEIKDENTFNAASKIFEEKEGKFLLKKEAAGLFLFLERKEIPRRIDFFLNLYEPKGLGVLTDLINFQKNNNVALSTYIILPGNVSGGYPEEEIKVALAVKKLFPEKFGAYLIQRLKNIRNTSCADSLGALGLDYKKIMEFVKSKNMESLLKENAKLAQELSVSEGNVILINNNRLFKVFQIKAEDLKKFF